VPRRRKALVDLVRDGTFSARKDELLLAGRDELPWPALEEYRGQFRAAGDDFAERREISLELERALRHPDAQAHLLGDLQAELRKLGPADSVEQLLRFAPWAFRHTQGAIAGQPYTFPPNHDAFLREFWRRDKHGRRLYQVGLLMEPKGCSKTPTAAVIGTHTTLTETDAPRVFQISGAKYQADFGHSFARRNVERGPLAAWVSVGGQTLWCPEHDGEFEILSAEGEFSAGANPTAALYDELFLFRHQHQREAWNSQAEALHKRSGRAFIMATSTAGWDKQTLLGEMYDAALEHPKIEELEAGYHLRLRDEAAGFLFWCHRAPDDADIENPAVVRAATPAPWIDPAELIRALNRSDVDELAWRRLHLNQWTKTKSSWLSSGVWAGLRTDAQIPEGAEILVGVDCARTFDTTSVAWAWIAPNGRKIFRSQVWSVRQKVLHHDFVPGGELVNEELVEPFVEALARRYRVRAIAFDPRYFSTEARHLANAGHLVVEVQPQTRAMGDAVVLFEKEARGGQLGHDGDRVLAGHVDAIDAMRLPDGGKKIGKRNEAYPIDAGIACVLANYLSSIDLPEPPSREPLFAWR
jgi:phage terminase large subunit-like protein